MEMLFMAVVAALVFFILIIKLASPVTNGDKHDRIHDSSKVPRDEFKSKTISKTKSKKKVRFAVDHEAFVVNKAVAGTSQTEQVVFEKNDDEESISLNDGVKSPEVGFGDVENESEKAREVVELSPLPDSVVIGDVIDSDETKEGKTELVDQRLRLSEGEENAGKYDDDRKSLCDDAMDEDEKEKEGLISDEDDSDDWEGVERSDLEKVFAMAADYANLDDNLQGLESNVQMQLYGLHKIATEGPCHEPQPMPLKLSARAKWNEWQKLGNMNPDIAMEQYITLLSEKIPGWSQGIHSVGTSLSSSLETIHKERETEIDSSSDVGNLIGVSDSVNQDKQ